MAIKNPTPPTLDFQSSDEAWYSVRLVLKGETLIVKYCNFCDAYDDRFSAAEFKDPMKLEDFILRFRPSSVQLQDNDCKKVIEGMTVCASYVFGVDDIIFYDAVVEEVNFKDHKFEKEEVCTGTFLLFWLCGPNEGKKTDAVVAHICLLQPVNAQMNQTLSAFREICREKHRVALHYSGCVGEDDIFIFDIYPSHKVTLDSVANNKLRSPHFESPARSSKEVKIYRHSVSTARKFKRQSIDMDLGRKSGLVEDLRETSGFHFMLVENLEKDLSSSAIVDFVKKHVSITPHAQVLPSLSSELCTRGIIIVDSQEELQKLSDFLFNTAHMILSSRGRPWVITEKKFWHGAVGVKIGNSTMLPENRPWGKSLEVGEKVIIVSKGTEEYESGKQLKNLFLKFVDHQQGLLQ